MALAATLFVIIGAYTFFISIRGVHRQLDDLDRRTHFLLDTSRAVWDTLLKPGVLSEQERQALQRKLLALMNQETRDQEDAR